jgi:hypothetical protein
MAELTDRADSVNAPEGSSVVIVRGPAERAWRSVNREVRVGEVIVRVRDALDTCRQPVRLYFRRTHRALQSDQNPLHIEAVSVVELLTHAEAIFRLSGVGPVCEEPRYNHSLAVNLILAEFDPSFGRRKSRHQ